MDFTAGYGIASMALIQLFFVCELGENIQVKMNGKKYSFHFIHFALFYSGQWIR